MRRWVLTAPCCATLTYTPPMSAETVRVGTEAALVQLSGVLPAGSIIALHTGEVLWSTLYPAACQAITAAGSAAEPVTVVLPAPRTTDAVMSRLLSQVSLVHAATTQLLLAGADAGAARHWDSLHVSGTLDLADLLHLPDPSKEAYDIYVKSVKIHPEKV